MSESTLYQVPEGLHGALSGVSLVDTLVTAGVLVPVERCEHRMIDPHVIDSLGGPQEWCDGAGIGADDE